LFITLTINGEKMRNFTYFNPVKILFGKGRIAELSSMIPQNSKVMFLYGGGSIKKNGVYDQVKNSLKDYSIVEFFGIEANPLYETCMEAVNLARQKEVNFLLAVGGGSVLDATKFIAASMEYDGEDPWDIMEKPDPIKSAPPLASIMTVPATGSEMNGGSVISRESIGEKLHFVSHHVFPQFSILDPEVTKSLPKRQTVNAIVDTYVHVLEQYLTYDVNTPLQDRQAEAILKTVIEESGAVLEDPDNYETRANLMWCSTNALNNLIGCGVVHDWGTHMIGHELTALYGIDHGQSLAVVMPAMMQHQRDRKREKILQYGKRIFDINLEDEDVAIDMTIESTKEFFHAIGSATSLKAYDIPEEAGELVASRIAKRGMKIGEHGDIGAEGIKEILNLAK